MTSSVANPAIRYAMDQDVPSMVDIHLRSFPSFFLSFLGAGFLRELYGATIVDQEGIAFVAEDRDRIVGFSTGTSEPTGFYLRLLRQRWWRFGLACVRPLIRRPSIAPRLLRAFRRPHENDTKTGRATLMSIAVRPEAQGTGTGKWLVRAFLQEAARRGCRQVDLTTDKDNNNDVNAFYAGLGFRCERSFVTPEGRAMNEYVIDVAGTPDATNPHTRSPHA